MKQNKTKAVRERYKIILLGVFSLFIVFIGCLSSSKALAYSNCDPLDHVIPCIKVNTQHVMDTVVGSPNENVAFFDSNYFYYNGSTSVICGTINTSCNNNANYYGDLFIYSSGSWSLYNGGGNFSGAGISSSSAGFYWLGVGGPPASCFDGIQNQDETGVDTGGVCATITRIYHTQPITNSTTLSETFNIKYDYYVNSGTDPTMTKILITICPKSYTINDCYVTDQNITGYDSLYENTISFTASSGKDGLYHIDIALWNGVNTTTCAWYQFTCKTKTAVYSAQDFWEFNVKYKSGTNGIPAVIDDNTFYTPPSPSTCAIANFDAMDCIINIFKYVFIPTPNAFDSFLTLKDQIAKKPPFGYISGIYTAINGIKNDQANSVFILESVTPINTLLFDPIRIALQWILYFAFAFALFHRFKNIQI